MKKQYISPQTEEIKVNATLELLAGSSRHVSQYLNVTNGGMNIIAE